MPGKPSNTCQAHTLYFSYLHWSGGGLKMPIFSYYHGLEVPKYFYTRGLKMPIFFPIPRARDAQMF